MDEKVAPQETTLRTEIAFIVDRGLGICHCSRCGGMYTSPNILVDLDNPHKFYCMMCACMIELGKPYASDKLKLMNKERNERILRQIERGEPWP